MSTKPETQGERAEFEKWLRARWTFGYACAKLPDGKYTDTEAQSLWECWQAAALLAADGKAGGEVRLDICAGYVHQSFLDEAAATGNAVDVQIMRDPFPGGAAIFTRLQQAAPDAEWLARREQSAFDAGKQAAQVAQPLILPPHKCGLFLTHNEHRDYYEKLEQFIVDQDLVDDFESPESMQKSIDTDECWVLQWYPNTPVGFNRVAGPTLEGVLARATAQGVGNDQA